MSHSILALLDIRTLGILAVLLAWLLVPFVMFRVNPFVLFRLAIATRRMDKPSPAKDPWDTASSAACEMG